MSQSESLQPSGGFRTSGARPTVPPSINPNPNRNKVRTRVRRPPSVEEPLVPLEPGPPQFALSSAEDIQKFRESNPFVNSDQGRLTVLNSNFDRRPNPAPVQNFQREPEPQNFERNPEIQNFQRNPGFGSQRNQSPVRSFAAIPAVPEDSEPVSEAAFGSRFKSRRPPSRNPEPEPTFEDPTPPRSNFRGRPQAQDIPSRNNFRSQPAVPESSFEDPTPPRSNFRYS